MDLLMVPIHGLMMVFIPLVLGAGGLCSQVSYLSLTGFGEFEHAILVGIEGLHTPTLQRTLEQRRELVPFLASLLEDSVYTYDCRR